MRAEFGFGQGFKDYRYRYDENLAQQMQALRSWIADRASTPFFAFVHGLDPHGPYTPADETYQALFSCSKEESLASRSEKDVEILSQYDMFYQARSLQWRGKPLPSDFGHVNTLEEHNRSLHELSERGCDYFRNLYDAEIAYVDKLFADLFGFLEAQSLLEDTVVVFTSDHGEGFNEHGAYLHGGMPYEEKLHVPLLVWAPGARRGERIGTNVGLMDLYPTLIALAGAECPSYIQARQLLTDAMTPSPDANNPQMSWGINTSNVEQSNVTMVLDNFKILTYQGGEKVKLFDLASDPEERRDLIALGEVHEEVLSSILKRLATEKQAHAKLAGSFSGPAWIGTNEEYQQELEAIGYL